MEYIALLLCEKITGLFFVSIKCKSETQSHSDPKMFLAGTFLCCATIENDRS